MRVARLGGAAAAAALAWGHFEAGWVRLETLRCPLPGLPPELDGLRIAHLSDFHLGFPSRGSAAIDRAVEVQSAAREQLRNSELLVQTQRQHLEALQVAFNAGGADALEVNGARLELSAGLLARLDAEFRTHQALGQLEEALRLPFDGLGLIERDGAANEREEDP